VLKRSGLAGFCVFLCWIASGCSSGNNNTQGQGGGTGNGFTFTSPTSSPSIDVGQSVTLTVSATATWTLQPGSGFNKPVGTLSSTAASTSVTYSVPSSATLPNNAPAQDVIIATSTANTSVNAAMAVVVNPPLTLQTLSTHLTSNEDCSYSPTLADNDGTVGQAYLPGAEVGSLAVAGGTAPYSWTLHSGALPAGLTLQSSAAANFCGNAPSCAFLQGTPVNAACSQLAIEVTDATGENATSPTYFVVITPAALSVQVPNYTDLYQGVAYPPTTLSVSGGVAPYTWTVADSADNPLPAGVNLTTIAQNTSSAYLSGTPTSNSPIPLTPTVMITDSQAPYPAVGIATLTFNEYPGLTPSCAPTQGFSTSNSAMQGSYAFLLRGFDSNGPAVIAGSFTADGSGNVTAGEEDVMRNSGSQADLAITPASSSYSIFEQTGDDGNFTTRGCAILTAGGTTITFSFSLGGCTTSVGNFGLCNTDAQGNSGLFTTGRIIEFDGKEQLSGIIRQQNTSAFSSGLSAGYAFGLSGRDNSGGRFASAGSFTANSGTLTVAADINDAGTLQSNLIGETGTASALDSNGRGTVTLNAGTNTFNLVTYAVSTQDFLLASSGTASAENPIVSGEAIAATGPFSPASLQNSHMFHIAGLASAGPDPSIGVLTFDGISAFTGTQYEDQAGTLSTTPLSGAYTVDSTSGRFPFNYSSSNNVIVHPFVGYAIPVPGTLTRTNCAQPASCVTGFLISTDSAAQAGTMEFQTPTTAPPPPFSSLYLSGYYFFGTDESLDSETPVIDGSVDAIPNGSVYSGVENASYPANSVYCHLEPTCTTLLPNLTLGTKGSYSVSSSGTATLGGETVGVTNGNVTFYLDESPLNTHPSVVILEQ
jgi:large repetitive protein